VVEAVAVEGAPAPPVELQLSLRLVMLNRSFWQQSTHRVGVAWKSERIAPNWQAAPL
jgi:hypothetical protein